MNKRMKLSNSTHLSTRDLRKWLLAGLKERGVDPDTYTIYVSYCGRCRDKSVHGHAYIRRPIMSIFFPSPAQRDINDPVSMYQASQVLMHEIDHTLGIGKHRDMINWWTLDASWGADFTIGVKKPKEKQPRDLKAEREEKARKKLIEWEKKLKKAQMITKKWKAKVKYYERAKAADAKRTK